MTTAETEEDRVGLPPGGVIEDYFNRPAELVVLLRTDTDSDLQSLWIRPLHHAKYKNIFELPAGEKVSEMLVSDHVEVAAFTVSTAHPNTTGRLFAGIYLLNLRNLEATKVSVETWDGNSLQGRRFWVSRLFAFDDRQVIFALAALLENTKAQYRLVRISPEFRSIQTVELWQGAFF